MDALTSISPYSQNPESRRRRASGEPFELPGGDGGRMDPPPWEASSNSSSTLSALAEACSTVSGPADAACVAKVAAIAKARPSVLAEARISHDGRAPIQAFPALALAAIQGADPEGWIAPLAAMGASFDAKLARAAARLAILDMPFPRGGAITELNARCESLSIWTLACAEAAYPHSALRAVEAARGLSPDSMAPLASELSRFPDPARHDKPGLHPKARAGAFVEAARELPGFASDLLPAWILGPRGGDIALIAGEVAEALGPAELSALAHALAGRPEPAADVFMAALGTRTPRDLGDGSSPPQ